MKKTYKLFCLLAICGLASIASRVYSSTEDDELYKGRYNTNICLTTDYYGHQVWGSQCGTKDKDGPCDRYTSCKRP